jgi:hypothetical protein
MYIPIDADTDTTLSKGERKMQREKDVRQARKQIKSTIEHWQKMFNGEQGKPYFKVGEIIREEGWLEQLPRRELCESAQKQRPKRAKDKKEKKPKKSKKDKGSRS